MITVNQDKLKAIKLADCKATATTLLAATDWSTLPDASAALENAEEFVAYRNSVRGFIVQPVEAPLFPTVPKAVWRKG